MYCKRILASNEKLEIWERTNHQGVNQGVDPHEHPNGRAHEADASPHAEHCTGVVVGLQSGAALALGDDDEGVQDFVELGQVEPEAPESETLVPEPSNVRRIRTATRAEQYELVLVLPHTRRGIVVHSISKSPRAMHFAQSVGGTSKTILRPQARPWFPKQLKLAIPRPSVSQRPQHAPAHERREDSEQDIVRDDEDEEQPRLADPPRLVAARAIPLVDEHDGDCVDGGDGRRDLPVQRTIVECWLYAEGCGEGALVFGRREGQRRRVGREAEDPGWRETHTN